MYAIYGNIYHQYTPNVSIYTIHGSHSNSIGSHWPHTPIASPGCRFAGPLSQRVGSWLAITVGLPGRGWLETAWNNILKVQNLVSCRFLSPILSPLIQLVIRFTRFVAHPFWPGYIQQLRGVREGKAWGVIPSWYKQYPYGMVPSNGDFIPYIHHGFCGVFTVVWMGHGIIPDSCVWSLNDHYSWSLMWGVPCRLTVNGHYHIITLLHTVVYIYNII